MSNNNNNNSKKNSNSSPKLNQKPNIKNQNTTNNNTQSQQLQLNNSLKEIKSRLQSPATPPISPPLKSQNPQQPPHPSSPQIRYSVSPQMTGLVNPNMMNSDLMFYHTAPPPPYLPQYYAHPMQYPPWHPTYGPVYGYYRPMDNPEIGQTGGNVNNTNAVTNNRQVNIVVDERPPLNYSFKTTSFNETKMKPSSFPASKIKIGTWETTSQYQCDIVGKFYFTKKQIVWELSNSSKSLKMKMVLSFGDIVGLVTKEVSNEEIMLTVEINKQPKFYKETNPQPKKNTMWIISKDFTKDSCASVYCRHEISCKKSSFSKHIEKLKKSDTKLHALLDANVFSSQSIYIPGEEPDNQDNYIEVKQQLKYNNSNNINNSSNINNNNGFKKPNGSISTTDDEEPSNEALEPSSPQDSSPQSNTHQSGSIDGIYLENIGINSTPIDSPVFAPTTPSFHQTIMGQGNDFSGGIGTFLNGINNALVPQSVRNSLSENSNPSQSQQLLTLPYDQLLPIGNLPIQNSNESTPNLYYISSQHPYEYNNHYLTNGQNNNNIENNIQNQTRYNQNNIIPTPTSSYSSPVDQGYFQQPQLQPQQQSPHQPQQIQTVNTLPILPSGGPYIHLSPPLTSQSNISVYQNNNNNNNNNNNSNNNIPAIMPILNTEYVHKTPSPSTSPQSNSSSSTSSPQMKNLSQSPRHHPYHGKTNNTNHSSIN